MKVLIRFEKLEKMVGLANPEVLALLSSKIQNISSFIKDSTMSLASTNQRQGFIQGTDYLFTDIEPDAYGKKNELIERLNRDLAGFVEITHIVHLSTLRSPYMNRYSYYIADLSEFECPSDFFDNLTYIQTRDTNATGESITVTENRLRIKGAQQYVVKKTYAIIELVRHLYYDATRQHLYFIADGNAPAFVLLAGLLFGKCVFDEFLTSNIRLHRLDYLDGTEKILHNTRFYVNVLGDDILLP